MMEFVSWDDDYSQLNGENKSHVPTLQSTRLIIDCKYIYIYLYNYIIPSGKRLHNRGTSPFSSWVNPLFQWPFSIAFCMFTRPGISGEIDQPT